MTEAEQERLVLLIEECAEVQQVACKILRHGYQSNHPNTPDISNRMELEKELGHLMNIYMRMTNVNDLNYTNVIAAMDAKKNTVKQWLHHQ